MDAKGAALSNNPVQQKGRGLGNLIVLDKELLEFIDQQQGARDGLGSPSPLIAGEVLDAKVSEQIPAAPQFVINPLQHAQTKLAIALDCHHPSMREVFGGVAFEFNSLFEIDQIK